MLLEADLTWLVIVNNGNLGLGVQAKQLDSVDVVQLDKEVLVWFPLVVIKDLDLNVLVRLSSLEVDELVNGFVVLSSLGLCVNGLDLDGLGLLLLVLNVDPDLARALTHAVMQALEPELWVPVLLIEAGGMEVFLLHDLTLGNNWFLAGHGSLHSLAVLDPG